MPAFRVSMFAGMTPAISPRLISDEHAALAKNVLLQNGELAAIEDVALSSVQPKLPKNTRTLYKYNNKWFAWSLPVEVIPSPIIADPFDRVYFSGLDKPRVTRNDIATGSGVLPSLSFPLGVPAPKSPPAIAYTPDKEDEPDYSDDSTRFYVLTYVSSTGEESAPSPLSARVVVNKPDDIVGLSWSGLAVNANDVSHVRIYRSETGSSESGFFRVAELPISATSYNDELPADGLGATLQTTDYAEPPETMRGLTNIAGGIVLGFDNRTLYVSEAFEPYTYPNSYRQTTAHKIVAICPLSSGAIVATEGYPYLVMGTMPGALSLTKFDEPYPCVSNRSMVNMNGFAIYASQDGLVGVSSGGAQLLTDQIFSPEQWRELNPETMHCYYHDGMYIAFYGDTSNTGNGKGALVYNPQRKDVYFVDIYATAGFRDLAADTLFLVVNDKLNEWRKGNLRKFTWKSRVVDTPPMSFQCFQIRAKNTSGIQITIFADDDILFSYLYEDHFPEPLFLPVGLFRRWQIQLEGTATVESVALATSMQELM